MSRLRRGGNPWRGGDRHPRTPLARTCCRPGSARRGATVGKFDPISDGRHLRRWGGAGRRGDARPNTSHVAIGGLGTLPHVAVDGSSSPRRRRFRGDTPCPVAPPPSPRNTECPYREPTERDSSAQWRRPEPARDAIPGSRTGPVDAPCRRRRPARNDEGAAVAAAPCRSIGPPKCFGDGAVADQPFALSALQRSTASKMYCLASAASPQFTTLTHLPGSRSL